MRIGEIRTLRQIFLSDTRTKTGSDVESGAFWRVGLNVFRWKGAADNAENAINTNVIIISNGTSIFGLVSDDGVGVELAQLH